MAEQSNSATECPLSPSYTMETACKCGTCTFSCVKWWWHSLCNGYTVANVALINRIKIVCNRNKESEVNCSNLYHALVLVRYINWLYLNKMVIIIPWSNSAKSYSLRRKKNFLCKLTFLCCAWKSIIRRMGHDIIFELSWKSTWQA